MVTQGDIDTAGAALTTSLVQEATQAVQTQVHTDETLITPFVCTPHVSTDHPVGAEASQVTVTVDETCQGHTYQTQALHDAASRELTQIAERQLGTDYSVSGTIGTMITKASSTPGQSTLTLQVTSSGTWTYQLTEGHVEHLKVLVAGKSLDEARTLLLATRGIQGVSITLSHGDRLPADPSTIAVEWLSVA